MEIAQDFRNAAPDLYETIVLHTSEAVIFADRGGAIRVWNPGAETLFGHSAAEVIGQSLDLIIPERLRRAHWNGFEGAVSTGDTKYAGRVLITRAVHKNGSTLYVGLSFGLVKDRDGAVTGAFAMAGIAPSRIAWKRIFARAWRSSRTD